MAKDLGKVCMVPMGEYNNDAQYEVLDLVMKDGALWCAKKDTRGNVPAEGEYWFLATKGAYLMAKEAGYEGSEAEFNEAIGAVAGVVARAESDHERAEGDHTTADLDHKVAGVDHVTAVADHETAGGDHTAAGFDHVRAEGDHTRAEEDHVTAARDHEAVDEFNTKVDGHIEDKENPHETTIGQLVPGMVVNGGRLCMEV